MKRSIFFFCLISVSTIIFGQCPSPGTYNSNTNLAFGDTAGDPSETCLVGGSITVPSNRSPDIILQRNGKFVIGSGNVGSGQTRSVIGNLTLGGNSAITMSTTDSLIIWGDLTMEGNDDINITSGTLYVYGSMTVNGNATFGAGGNVIIRENFTITGGNADVTVGGGFSVGGTADLGSENITINDGAVFSASDLATSGNVTIQNGGTIFVENDIDNGVTGTITNNNTGGDLDCTNNCCGSLCNPSTDQLTQEGNNVLPIKLAYFQAHQERNSVVLTWKTVSEDNFSHFELYKIAQKDRSMMAEISSTFDPNGDQYTLIDEKPSLGLNIYQLRSVDFDGYTEWFEPITLVFQPEDISFKLYPNAARPEELTTDIYEDFEVEVYDLVGRKVLSTLVKEKDLYSLRALEKGSYIFRYNINGHLETQRMIIR